jgi:hypothetical protein
MMRFFTAHSIKHWLKNSLIAFTFLLAVSNAIFYVSDTMTGKPIFAKALKVIGFCPAVPKVVVGEKGAIGETGPAGIAGDTGPAGACQAPMNLSALPASLVPSKDNTFSLGTSTLRWKDIQVGPGTIYLEDRKTGKQVALTVNSGTLLLDGTDSLRIGNIRLTKNGLESVISGEDIRIGNLGDTGYLSVATGIKFPDGSIFTKAPVDGVNGSPGSPGSQGPQGPQGPQGISFSPYLPISRLDGNQTPFSTVDLSKQILVMSDGTWLLPDGTEGQIMYFVQGNGGSAEDSYLTVAHLRLNVNGLAVQVAGASWSPFQYEAGKPNSSICTAIFTDGHWAFSNGRLR